MTKYKNNNPDNIRATVDRGISAIAESTGFAGLTVMATRLTGLRVPPFKSGKPVNPKVEKAMFLGGIAIILTASMYLIITDILKLLQLG